MTTFSGFDEPLENWSKLPHQFIDLLPQIESLAELKVILYILRHTWGFQEFEDWEAKCITTDEFQNGRKKRDGERIDSGIGLSKPSIYDGLEKAIAHGFLVKYVDNTDLGRVRHYYRLRIAGDKDGIVYATDPDRPGVAPWHTIDPEIRKQVYERFQGRCAYCERKATHWHYDHVVPKSRGGTDDFANLALACPQCNMSKNDRTPDEWGHPVIYYERDVKILYRGWLNFFTGGGKETLHRSEKDTIEIYFGIETDRAASAASPPPSQPVLLTPDPDQTTAFNGELDALFQNALKVEAQADGKRGPQKWGSLAQKQQYRAAAQKIVERKGKDELARAIADGLKRERKSRDSLVAWIAVWADNLDKPHPDRHKTTDNASQAFTREKARLWYGDRGNRDAGYQPGVDTSSPAFTREKARLWYGDRGNRDDGYQPG